MRQLLIDQVHANRHINRGWLEALREVPFSDLDAERGAFFGSIFATWNHILLGDRVWMGRIRGEPFPVSGLDQRPAADMAALRRERARTDDDLIEMVAGEADFSRAVDYSDRTGDPYRQPLHELLLHLFAHQQHHRGQISQMCHEMGLPIPDGGLLGYYRAKAG